MGIKKRNTKEVIMNDFWKSFLETEKNKPYFQKLEDFLLREKQANKTIYPDSKNIFSVFNYTPFKNIKVVIIGQDPYHGENQAHGLSFSVPESQEKIPPSLKNIFKEIVQEFPEKNIIPENGNLEYLAKQGVFLLNATLTVEAHKAGSHQKKGWELFTDTVIKTISEKHENIVFLLWGSFAHKKAELIDETKHCVLKSPHPSPLSAYRGFFGCNHFLQTNDYLRKNNKSEIDWLKW